MSIKGMFLSIPIAAVVAFGAFALRPPNAFSQAPSCGTLSCSASFEPCIQDGPCNGCDYPSQCKCTTYGSPVYFTSECATNSTDTACFCPITPSDGTGGGGGASGPGGCNGLWFVNSACGN